MLLLTRDEIAGLVTMKEAIDAVEKAFLKHARGKTVYPPKDQFTLPTREWRWWAFMPVYVEGMGVSCKIVSDYPENKARGLPTITATTILCDVETGGIKAVMDGTFLTAIRTGALGAIAAKYLARNGSKTVGIFGCGTQARTQLEGLVCAVRPQEIRINDPSSAAMDGFIKDMGRFGIPIKISAPGEVSNSDIVVAATISQTPVVLGELIKPGTHVTSIGAHTPDARELDDELIKKAKIVIDSPDALKSGDMKNLTTDPTEIKDVLSGKKVRMGDGDITLFKSVGTALQDIAVASLVYDKAIKAGIGKKILV